MAAVVTSPWLDFAKSLKAYFMSRDSLKSVFFIIGDAYVRKQYPGVGIRWDGDPEFSAVRGGSGKCTLVIECWISSKASDPEEPANALMALANAVMAELAQWIEQDKGSVDTGTDSNPVVTGLMSDREAFGSVHGCGIVLDIPWNKYGK